MKKGNLCSATSETSGSNDTSGNKVTSEPGESNCDSTHSFGDGYPEGGGRPSY